MIDACIVAKLIADTAVGAMVGKRVYPLILPENSPKPSITYRIVSTVRDYDLDGATGKSDVRLELNLWGSYGQVRNLGKAVIACLDEFSGVLSSTEGSCEVLLITLDDHDTGYDQVERSYYAQQDWMVQHVEDVSADGASAVPVLMAFTAATAVSQYRAVAAGPGGGTIVPANALDSTLPAIGIASTSGMQNSPVQVQSSGRIDNASWNWTLGQQIFVGPGGTLTQVPPAGPQGYQQPIGYPLSATSLLVEVGDAISFA